MTRSLRTDRWCYRELVEAGAEKKLIRTTALRVEALLKRLLLTVLLATAWLFALSPACAAPADEADFKPLFNGKDFDGWRFSLQKAGDPWPDNWKVKDGVISLAGGRRPHLVTLKEFTDFELRFEWRALQDKYNSGCYVRTIKDAANNQINLQKGSEGAMVGIKWPGSKPVPELQKKVGEWNEWFVRVVGDKLTLTCNGKPAWEATGFKPASGWIGLQAEEAAMEFRNLRLRELK
jgi:Domain of Unknown Function (DUF1080)